LASLKTNEIRQKVSCAVDVKFIFLHYNFLLASSNNHLMKNERKKFISFEVFLLIHIYCLQFKEKLFPFAHSASTKELVHGRMVN
jgi:hypothetical protein